MSNVPDETLFNHEITLLSYGFDSKAKMKTLSAPITTSVIPTPNDVPLSATKKIDDEVSPPSSSPLCSYSGMELFELYFHYLNAQLNLMEQKRLFVLHVKTMVNESQLLKWGLS